MNRPWQVWLVFSAALALLLAVVAWVSATALALDRAETEARQQARLEEAGRLALWRMDSLVSPLIIQETLRPYFAYRSFYPAERAFDNVLNTAGAGELLVPSPLLTTATPYVRHYFQLTASGEISSPRAPDGDTLPLALGTYVSTDEIAATRQALTRLVALIEFDTLAAALPLDLPEPVVAVRLPPLEQAPAPQNEALPQYAQTPSKGQQQQRSEVEAEARQRVAQQVYDPQIANMGNIFPAQEGVVTGAFRPHWADGELLLARRVRVGGAEVVQGCWLDWPALRAALLAEVRDLLPAAQLEPAIPHDQDQRQRLMAALPVRLVPGSLPEAAAAGLSPVQLSVALGWVCVLLAAAAVAVLLRGTLALSERRAAFVSAVTHELRTPLTTFRMYAEMLEGGMVPDPARHREYLATLHAEAVRLGHLVENVLAFARLERGRIQRRPEPVRLGELLDRVWPRLEDRARQAGLRLDAKLDAAQREWLVRADATGVEQVLFNLVDNACKYAAPQRSAVTGGDPWPADPAAASAGGRGRIELTVAADAAGAAGNGRAGFVRTLVRDDGPGIAPADAARIFHPFHKSARDAADSKPGVGLGLALSRRLARAMGGDLRLVDGAGPGACFELRLPRG